jgi:hypothetical protein
VVTVNSPAEVANDPASVTIGWLSNRNNVPLSDAVNAATNTPSPNTIAGRTIPLLARLGYFDRTSGLFSSLQTAHSITNSDTVARNVYVIAHGWASGYTGWVQQEWAAGRMPLIWDAFQGPIKPGPGDPTPYLHESSYTETNPPFLVEAGGMAREILSVDPNATVLAFSWIDESATDNLFDGNKSKANTTMAGMQLAEGLMQALAPDYYKGLGKVHLIGHSHGARVATVLPSTIGRRPQATPGSALNHEVEGKTGEVGQLSVEISHLRVRHGFSSPRPPREAAIVRDARHDGRTGLSGRPGPGRPG